MECMQSRHVRHGDCITLTNDLYELIVPLEWGIRVIHFSRRGKENLLYEQQPEHTEFTADTGWRIRGGHRLWTAPEEAHCYAADNAPITWTFNAGEAWFFQPPQEGGPAVRKSLGIRFSGDKVVLEHVVENTGPEPLTLSVWPITAMRPGGVQTIPLPPKSSIYPPHLNMAFWRGTAPNDPQLTYGDTSMQIHHHCGPKPIKLGLYLAEPAVRYERDGETFCLAFDSSAPGTDGDAPRPDGGMNYETYLCRHMVELESLSPLVRLMPRESHIHREYWGIQ